MRAAPSAALLLAALLLSGGARAVDLTDKQRPGEGVDKAWYGWQTLTSDGAALLLGGVGAVRLATDDDYANRGFHGLSATGLRAGLFVFGVGTPFVHAFHSQGPRTVGSFAMRVALPVLGALLLGSGGCAHADGPCLASGTGAYAGALGRALLAMAVDAGQAWDVEPAKPSRLTLLPMNRGGLFCYRF